MKDLLVKPPNGGDIFDALYGVRTSFLRANLNVPAAIYG